MKNFMIIVAMVMCLSTNAQANGSQIFVEIRGLVCDFCAQALEKVFAREEAVHSIDVNLDTKIVTISLNEEQTLDDELVTKLIRNAGYNVDAIHYGEMPQ